MTRIFDPLWSAGWLISAHALAAMAAIPLGLAQFALPKGTRAHRALGWLWVALMLSVAASSFWIHTIRSFGPFSAIHGLSAIVLVAAPLAALHGRSGRIARHRRAMIVLYLFALVLAGVFTLVPGRVMHHVVFGAS